MFIAQPDLIFELIIFIALAVFGVALLLRAFLAARYRDLGFRQNNLFVGLGSNLISILGAACIFLAGNYFSTQSSDEKERLEVENRASFIARQSMLRGILYSKILEKSELLLKSCDGETTYPELMEYMGHVVGLANEAAANIPQLSSLSLNQDSKAFNSLPPGVSDFYIEVDRLFARQNYMAQGAAAILQSITTWGVGNFLNEQSSDRIMQSINPSQEVLSIAEVKAKLVSALKPTLCRNHTQLNSDINVTTATIWVLSFVACELGAAQRSKVIAQALEKFSVDKIGEFYDSNRKVLEAAVFRDQSYSESIDAKDKVELFQRLNSTPEL